MAYVRLVVRGTIDSIQTFSFGMDFKVLGSGGVGPADLATWVTATGTPFATWFNTATYGLKIMMSNICNTTMRQAYYHPTDTGPASFSATDTSGGGAGTGTVNHPPQIALVHSLQTGFAGRKNRGRFYVPAMAVPSDGTTGRAASANVTGMSLAAGTFIDSVNGIALASNAVGCAVMPGGDIVTSVVVDNVFDTQRRRRDKIGATFTAKTVI